ncbi:MAG: glycosyltransferase family 39 protein [Gemmatimonadetes bacterium]|nr:glycosyltransferase family 39 protein [Gemmatimonadota bacterium]
MPASARRESPSEEHPAPRSSERAVARWLLIGVWAVSILNAVLYLDRGWFPHDLGSLAQPAMRVLWGQLPHRDFVDVYTGGLAFLDALVFRILTPTAMALRWALLAFFAAWVPAVWYVMRRIAGPVTAALATLLAAAWTLPMYAAGMPSWYNLFFATFSVAAIFRYLEIRRTRWLMAAGALAGVSILFKVIGLYAVAAGLLALTYVEAAEAPSAPPEGAPRGDAGYRWLVGAGALALMAMVIVLVTRAMGPGGLFRFATAAVIPCFLLAFLAARRRSGAPSPRRLAALMGLLAPFVAGVAVVVGIFVLPWLLTGSLGALIRGVFVLPRRRFADASWGGLRGGWTGPALAAAAVLLVGAAPRVRRDVRIGVGAALAVLLGAALALSGHLEVYVATWQGLWWLPPWVALAAAWAFFRSGVSAGDEGSRDAGTRGFILLAAFGMVSLVEVPFAAPIYFFFAAPLLVPMAFALSGRGGAVGSAVRRRWVAGLVVFLLGFTALRLDPGFIRHLGFRPDHSTETALLRLPRAGGLHVSPEDRDLYETVVPMVESLARGPYIYATPDSPEIYFLTGKRNPTRTLFEFLDPHPETRTARVLAELDRDSVNVVVINRSPLFSAPVSSDLVAGLQARYPMARTVGRFLVVWRRGPAPATR